MSISENDPSKALRFNSGEGVLSREICVEVLKQIHK